MAGVRGEAAIQTENGEVLVLYTNRALVDIEATTGKSILALAEGFESYETGITDIAHILRAGMENHRRDARAGGQICKLNDALNVLDEVGFTAVAAAVMEAVAFVLGYGVESEDDPNP